MRSTPTHDNQHVIDIISQDLPSSHCRFSSLRRSQNPSAGSKLSYRRIDTELWGFANRSRAKYLKIDPKTKCSTYCTQHNQHATQHIIRSFHAPVDPQIDAEMQTNGAEPPQKVYRRTSILWARPGCTPALALSSYMWNPGASPSG